MANEETKAKTEDVKEEVKETTSNTESTDADDAIKKEKKNKYKEKVLELEEELKKQKNEYLKVFAEMENTKKRLHQEAINDRKYASMNVVSELIQPIDMLTKIVNMEVTNPEVKNYCYGFQMITNQITDIMKNEGLKPIEALNKEFDPKVMQAVEVVTTDSVNENMVVEVMQNGYMYKDRVLKPAMVKVSKKPVEVKETPESKDKDQEKNIKEND